MLIVVDGYAQGSRNWECFNRTLGQGQRRMKASSALCVYLAQETHPESLKHTIKQLLCKSMADATSSHIFSLEKFTCPSPV